MHALPPAPAQNTNEDLCVNECVPVKDHPSDTLAVTKKVVNYKKAVGSRIKALRIESSLSQEILSERCGIFRTYLSRIESGLANPTLVVLVALANSLHVEPYELLLVDKHEPRA